jgi:hypothetical protein
MILYFLSAVCVILPALVLGPGRGFCSLWQVIAAGCRPTPILRLGHRKVSLTFFP